MNIKITNVAESRVNELDSSNLQFGKQYSDHMLICDFEDGAWQEPSIVPYGDITMSPATTFIHYGQSLFEGIKAYRRKNGEVAIFRPRDNWARFNVSARRMAMAEVPEELFMEGMRKLIEIDKAWVPDSEGSSLYIRPFMFGTDAFIGVKPADTFRFMIITSPAGAYYSKPTRIYVQNKFVRAFPGGIGFTKAAGNYGACMLPMLETKKLGYDQILWTDGYTHKNVQEIGTMNVFFVFGNTVVTPDLSEGTILAGVTRDSVIRLLREKGMTVEERAISIEEIETNYRNGQLKEAFGAGTAAVIAPISELFYNGETLMLPPVETWDVSNFIKKELADIRYGNIPDTHSWMYKVC
ncbi:MAG: branched-chain amino acid aminotransferase [Chitinophagaceae bacterium]|jgi:branched-chain amino acid aminotransferase|nr:branched-chain amino acid aminotransferase [Chitinophagaceae bacterium]